MPLPVHAVMAGTARPGDRERGALLFCPFPSEQQFVQGFTAIIFSLIASVFLTVSKPFAMSDFKKGCPSKPRGRALFGLSALLLLAGCALIIAVPCAADTGSSTSGTYSAALLDPVARTWSYTVDLSTFRPDEYLVKASAKDGDVAGTALFNVLEKPQTGRGSETSPSRGDMSDSSKSGYYYITVDPIADLYVGETFTITGRTNLPEGADIMVEVYASSFRPTSKTQSGEFSGASGTVQVTDSSADLIGSYDSQPPMINTYQTPAPVTTANDQSAVGADTKIIRTATVSLEVANVTETAASLSALARVQGGYVSSSDIESSGSRHYGTVIIRVPQARFESALSGVKSAGTVRSFSTKGDDVTEEYVDLRAQKEAYEAQLAQYYVLMKKAVKISDILAIQQQIDRVQTELNRLEGRLRYLDDRIDLSTITISLNEPVPIMAEQDQSPGHNFVLAVNKGIAGLLGLVDTVIEAAITFLPVIIIAIAGVWLYLKRKGKKPGQPVASGELTGPA